MNAFLPTRRPNIDGVSIRCLLLGGLLTVLVCPGMLPAREPAAPEDLPPALKNRWLIELDLPASAVDASPGRAARGRELDHAFRESLEQLREEADGLPRVVRHFDRLWPGYSVEATPEQAARLTELPGVRTVYPERPIWALLDETVPWIGATLLHERLPSVTGAGVEIAVIDTGVDYNHPDLGGGFGPAFRVVDGYDFVDDDDDPMDLHGHGTHVAATAAGDGMAGGNSWPGVAPEATLLAVRVLTAAGTGSQADLIAGLEWASDPDEDPGTFDQPDVVLTALGGFGFPDDPASQAADLLVQLGTVVVAGSGNFGGSGTRYQSILSPGTARSVLTVGASEIPDDIAGFSSRGFAGVFFPKPNLIAPGADVCAARRGNWLPPFTCVDSTHVETSGTSVAAAHVAGAAALMLEVNPDWTIDEVRAALQETALDLGEDLLTQGSGRLRADLAADADAVIQPPTLVPGRVDLCAADWSSSRPFSVVNLGAFPATFDLALNSNPPAGVAFSLDTNVLAVPAGDERTATLQVDVDPAVAPVMDVPPFGYTAEVVATSVDRPGLELRAPVWVPASPSLPLSFGFQPLEVYVHDRAGTVWRYVAPGAELEAALPVGTYDVLVVTPGPQQIIVREGVNVDLCDSGTVNIVLADAPHSVSVDLRTQSGEALPSNPARCDLVVRHDGGFLYQASEINPLSLRLSGMSGAYRVEWTCADRDSRGDLHVATGGATGLSADLPILVAPTDWRRVVLRGRREAGDLWMGASLARIPSSPGPGEVSTQDLNGPGPDPAARLRTHWVTPLPWPDFAAYAGPQVTVGTDPWPAASYPVSLRSLLFVPQNGNMEIRFSAADTAPAIASIPEDLARLDLGLPPFAFAAATENLANQIRLVPARGDELALFRGQLGSHRPVESTSPAGLPYDLRQGAFQDSGTLSHAAPYFFPPVSFVLPGAAPTELEITFDGYEVAGQPGTATALLSMDTSAADLDPPALWRLQVLQAGPPTDTVLECRGPATLRADFTEDAGTLASVVMEVRENGAPVWTPLSTTLAGGGVEGDLPFAGTTRVLDVRLVATDGTGNFLEVRAEPAYREFGATAASDPGDTLVVTRDAADVLLEWTGTAQGAYAVLKSRQLPLVASDAEAPVVGPAWTDTDAVLASPDLVYYGVVSACP